MTISVIGLGKLGACMAAAMASRGFSVVGYDVNPQAVSALAAGNAPVTEPQLQELISAHRDRLRATGDLAEAVRESEISFVVVPTPSDESGAFSIAYARAACSGIGRVLATKPTRHHVILSSTVLPGSCRYGLIPAIEQASGKTCGRDFDFTYSPEFIALGSVIRDFLNPDFTLVGEFDAAGGSHVEALYREVLPQRPPCRRMSLENAELAKITLNAYVTMKIAFANMIADFCEQLPGGDARAVCDALGADARIGRRYLYGGPSFGGPCFPRDNCATAVLARQLGLTASLPLATDQSNEALHERIAALVLAHAPADRPIAVLGLAYKPDTIVVEASAGIELCRRLIAARRKVIAFDPLANDAGRAALPREAQFGATILDCLRSAGAVVVTTPDPAFRTLPVSEWQALPGKLVVFDLWACLREDLGSLANIRLIRRGRGLDDAKLAQPLQTWWGNA